MTKPRSKVAFVLIDGVGDVNIPSLGFKTPLQAARTEILDAVAGRFPSVCSSLASASPIIPNLLFCLYHFTPV